jgi:hypothetical protein
MIEADRVLSTPRTNLSADSPSLEQQLFWTIAELRRQIRDVRRHIDDLEAIAAEALSGRQA